MVTMFLQRDPVTTVLWNCTEALVTDTLLHTVKQKTGSEHMNGRVSAHAT